MTTEKVSEETKYMNTPERRILYIDVGNLPKTKTEEYMNALVNRYRNKLSENTTQI